MNIRLVALCIALSWLAVYSDVKAAPKSLPPAAAPQAVSEKDVLGDWQTQGEGWRMVLNADHTAAIYSEGVIESQPSSTTWKLTDNRIIIGNASLLKTGKLVELGNDFVLIPHKNQLVMLSKTELPIAEKHGFAACNCLWRSPQKSDKGKY